MRSGRHALIGAAAVALLILGSYPASRAETRAEVLARVPPQWRSDVGRVLDLAAAEWNDGELIAALEAYPAGTARHRAVCFLIANMDKHLYVEYVNPSDPLNPFGPEDEDIDWAREYVWDYSTMTAELLIENVEWAFLARETFAWCRSLPEDIFFEYVLPYRSTQEPLHSWRPALYEQYAPTTQGLGTALDVTEAVNACNTQIFHFDSLYYRHPEDRDIPTLLACGVGRCEDMSNISNYSLRAVGVPTTSDFTPRWPKGDNNHAWNAVWSGGRWYTFMGCEAGAEPVWDAIKNRPFAKVYRESFSADPIMGPAPDGTQPPRLMRVAAIDVTPEYTRVSDVSLRVDNPDRATYLCVFNFGAWREVAGAWADEDRVRFRNVGNQDILYCATRYVEDETGWGDHIPVAPPFILHLDGSLGHMDLSPESEPAGDIVLAGWDANSTLDEGQEVTLFRYVTEDDESAAGLAWKAVGTATAAQASGGIRALFYGAAVERGLYLLSDSDDAEDFREGSRPFVWSSDGIVYY